MLKRNNRAEEPVVSVEAYHHLVIRKECGMMVSTEHIDDQKSGKRPWLKPLMRVTAIVLSLVCSFAGVWATFVFQQVDIMNWAILEMLFLGAVSAVLFRSWWAVLFIPIAFAVGGVLAFFLISLVISPNPLAMDDAPFGVFLWAAIGPILTALGAIFGTAIVNAWVQGQKQRTTTL
jgi:hypothetical protein